MKMYCLFDTVRQKYFRLLFDGRDPFTVKPYELLVDRDKLEDRAKTYSKKADWELYGYKGPVPKLVVKTFNVEGTEDATSAHRSKVPEHND